MVGNCQPHTLQWPGSVLMLWLLYIFRADIRPNMILYMFTADPGDRKAYAVNCKFFLSTNLPSKKLGQFYNNDIHLDLLMNIVRITINYFIIRNSATNIVTYTVDQKQIDHQIHYFSYNWRIPPLRPWKTCFPSPLFRQTQKNWGIKQMKIFHQIFPHLCFYWIRFISTQRALKKARSILYNDTLYIRWFDEKFPFVL